MTTAQKVHDTYLPFTADQLQAHFAKVTGAPRERDAYTRYYRESAERYRAWTSAPSGVPRQRPSSLDVQVEKDERFWTVAALMGLFHGGNRRDDFASLLDGAFAGGGCPVEGFDTWADALGEDVELFFEVNMPSPASYKEHLKDHLEERVLTPTALERAQKTTKLEGSTKVDAVLVSRTTGTAVLFEAKVLSDISTTVTFDVLRNQLARLVDVTLDVHPKLAEESLAARRPERTCVVLLTPALFKTYRSARLYGHLHDAYRSRPSALPEHLPHRDADEVAAASQRIGWATWEDVKELRSECLPWVGRPTV